MTRRVWRLVKAMHAANPLDGEGARLFGGRWSSPGQPVVYLFTEIGCAALEVLVHIGRIALAPADYLLVAVTIPVNIWRTAETVRNADLPDDWRAAGAAACVAAGDSWLTRPKHPALLLVPSAVVPGVQNVLLDPAHADAVHAQIDSSEPFSFDPGLFRKLPRVP